MYLPFGLKPNTSAEQGILAVVFRGVYGQHVTESKLILQ